MTKEVIQSRDDITRIRTLRNNFQRQTTTACQQEKEVNTDKQSNQTVCIGVSTIKPLMYI